MGKTHGKRTHLPGNRCPDPITQIAVSHPQNTSPPINHSGEPVSFSCSDESDPCVGLKARSAATLEQLHTSPQLTVKVLTKTTMAGTTSSLALEKLAFLRLCPQLSPSLPPLPVPTPPTPQVHLHRSPFAPPRQEYPHIVES